MHMYWDEVIKMETNESIKYGSWFYYRYFPGKVRSKLIE